MPAEPLARPGALVLSIDLGPRRPETPGDGDRERDHDRAGTITRILDLLGDRDIHATWSGYFSRSDADALAQISARPNQEVGLIGPDLGASASEFEATLVTALEDARAAGFEIRSMVGTKSPAVPPAVRARSLAIARRHGILAVRGPQRGWAQQPSGTSLTATLRKSLRLADNFSLLLPDAAASWAELADQPDDQPVEIPATRWIRGFDPALRSLEPLRVHRLQSEMTYAAERGRIDHLWLRPLDWGPHLHENLLFLDNLLRNAKALAGRVGFGTLTLHECAAAIDPLGSTGGVGSERVG